MADTLQLAKAERKFDTLRNVRVEALVDMLANPVLDTETKRPLDTLSDMKAAALMDTLADTLAEVEAKTL